MRDTKTAYPVKVTSRNLSSVRSNKIRVSWFILGTAFGMGCATALTPFIQPKIFASAQNAPANAPAVSAPAVVADAATPAPAVSPAAPQAAEAPPSVATPAATVASATPTPVTPAQPPAAPAPAIAAAEKPAAPVALVNAKEPAAGVADAKPAMSLDAIVSQPHTEQWPDPTPETTASATPARRDKDKHAEAEEAKQYPMALNLKVNNGDTLTNMLTDAGVSYDEAHNVVDSVRKNYDPKKLDVGQNISVSLDKQDNADHPVIASLSLPVSATSSLEVNRKGNGDFEVKKVDVPVERHLARAGGRISSSLYETGISTGLPASLLSELITAYSYDVDFQRDIQNGDSMDVLFERKQTTDGTPAGYGNVVYAELDLGDRVLKLYRYLDAQGNADYYNEKGESVRKALLRTPINGARVTSGFGLRTHPLLGYTKMHRGIDFGAAMGTPIYASGDGQVEFVGRRGGYGNYLRIRHNTKYESAYGHISRFASGIAPGKHVKQGQIIAYVGATGMATGPHLHYEILFNGDQVNPANVKFKNGNILQGKELLAFRQSMQKIEAKLASIPSGKQDKQVAMLEQPKKDAKN